MAEEMNDRQRYFFEPLNSKEELRLWLKIFLGMELPDETVDEESNSNILQFIWSVYDAMRGKTGPKRFVAACARNSGKTLAACVIRFLGMCHYRRNGTHLAATLEQSSSATIYISKIS